MGAKFEHVMIPNKLKNNPQNLHFVKKFSSSASSETSLVTFNTLLFSVQIIHFPLHSFPSSANRS